MQLELILAWNKTAFEIGGFGIQWYAICIATGALLGYFIFKQEGLAFGVPEDDLLDLVFWGIILGLIGARLYYVLFSLDNYIHNPIEIFNVRGGGMAIYGGVIAGMATLYTICRQRNLSFVSILDAASPAMLLAQAIGRWGNFVNQEAHGDVVSRTFLESLGLPQWLIDQMNIDGNYYHPTFLYESLWNVLGFVIILLTRHRLKSLKQGDVMAFYLIWYGTGRAVIEGMRTDSLYLGPLRVSQWLSIIMIIFGVIWMIYRRNDKRIPYYHEIRLARNGVDK